MSGNPTVPSLPTQPDLPGLSTPISKVLLPSLEGMGIVETPLDISKANQITKYDRALSAAMESSDPLAKALAPPPSAFSFATMSYMPDPEAGGLLSWPGIPPEAIQRLARTMLAPEMIIGMRVVDVMRYSQRSSHPWRPGWRVELRQAAKTPSAIERKEIKEAESFIENCNIEYGSDQVRARDAAGYTAFRKFLANATRDFLTYDAMAIWTDMDRVGRIKAWNAQPPGYIRLADPSVGFRGHKEWFAVLVDQGGAIKRPFTRDELIWYVGNPRDEPDIGGYPWSRIEVGMKLIDTFQNAVDMNSDSFTKSSIPMGMMLLKGSGFTNNELDALTRQYQNLKKGISKFWSIPVLGIPKDSDVEFLNLSAAHGQDMMYQHHMNLVAGVFCAILQFPHRRLGWHLSGGQRDSEPLDIKAKTVNPSEEEDIGLITLFGHLEHAINQYVLQTRFPDLQLSFTGKAPREDAREYEAKQLSRTWGERRAEVDLPPLESLVAPEDKELLAPVARLLSLCPADPGMAGVFQNIVAGVLGGAGGGGGDGDSGKSTDGPKMPRGGARFPASRDPVATLDHGGIAGVRSHGGRGDSRKRHSLI